MQMAIQVFQGADVVGPEVRRGGDDGDVFRHDAQLYVARRNRRGRSPNPRIHRRNANRHAEQSQARHRPASVHLRMTWWGLSDSQDHSSAGILQLEFPSVSA